MWNLGVQLEEGLARVRARIDHLEQRLDARVDHAVKVITERITAMGLATIADVINALNASTNLVAAHMQKLLDQLSAGAPLTADQVASFQAVVDHLNALGADPANPIPATPPAATATPVPAPATETTPAQ